MTKALGRAAWIVISAAALAVPAFAFVPAAPGESTNACPEGFDEAYYLKSNPDVAAAVQSGAFPNGCAHYREWGEKEGRAISDPNKPKAGQTTDSCTPPEGFDASYYGTQSSEEGQKDQLKKYWDSKGDSETKLCSGQCSYETWLCKHYDKWGKDEGRAISAAHSRCSDAGSVSQRCGSEFDTDFYLEANGDVGAVMGKYACSKRTFTDACSHYLLYGQFEVTADGHMRLTHEGQKHPAEMGLTAAQLAEAIRDIRQWGRLVYRGPTPIVRGPLGCRLPGAPPDNFSPGPLRECTQAEITAHNNGGKPIECTGGYTLVQINGNIYCLDSQAWPAVSLDGPMAFREQEPQLVAYLVARGMNADAAAYFLRAFAPCNIQSTVCSNLMFTSANQHFNTPLDPSRSNPPDGLYQTNWFAWAMLYGDTTSQTYNGSVQQPRLCNRSAAGYVNYCAPPPAVVNNTPAPPPEQIGVSCGVAGKPRCNSCRMPGVADFSPPRPECPAGIQGWNG